MTKGPRKGKVTQLAGNGGWRFGQVMALIDPVRAGWAKWTHWPSDLVHMGTAYTRPGSKVGFWLARFVDRAARNYYRSSC